MAGISDLPPFALERFFARHEFTAKHLLCCSDCEPLRVRDLLVDGGGGAAGAGGKGRGDAREKQEQTKTSPSAAVDALLDVRLSYTETRGDPELRAAIAKHVYGRVRRPLDPHHEVLTVVPQEGILLATAALQLKRGEVVVATRPGYQSLYANAASCGARVLAWQCRKRSAAESCDLPVHAFDADDLERLVRPTVDAWRAAAAGSSTPPPPLLRAVFVNFISHNPTGFLASDALWLRVRDVLREASDAQRRGCEALRLPPPPPVVLFSDEMYAHMEPWRDGAADAAIPRITTALDMDDDDDDDDKAAGSPPPTVAVVVLCGLSKSWGCPGLRLGWLASRSHRALLDRAAEIKDYTTICAPGPCERLGLAAVEATATLTARSRGRVARNASRARAFFHRWGELFEWPGAPQAGPICFPAARPKLLTLVGASDVGELCDRLVEESGVLLLPATVYDDDDDEGEDGVAAASALLEGRFRFGLGRDEQLFEEGLRALDGWLLKRFLTPAAGGEGEGADGVGGGV
jgi:aspartate/methionine/tyrosine aminotransferase